MAASKGVKGYPEKNEKNSGLSEAAVPGSSLNLTCRNQVGYHRHAAFQSS